MDILKKLQLFFSSAELPQTSPAPPCDKFTISSPKFVRNKDAKLSISAPKRLWLQRQDWVNGPIPSEEPIQISNVKSDTALVRRLVWHQKKIARQKNCKTKNSVEIYHVPVLKDELINEKLNQFCPMKQMKLGSQDKAFITKEI